MVATPAAVVVDSELNHSSAQRSRHLQAQLAAAASANSQWSIII